MSKRRNRHQQVATQEPVREGELLAQGEGGKSMAFTFGDPVPVLTGSDSACRSSIQCRGAPPPANFSLSSPSSTRIPPLKPSRLNDETVQKDDNAEQIK